MVPAQPGAEQSTAAPAQPAAEQATTPTPQATAEQPVQPTEAEQPGAKAAEVPAADQTAQPVEGQQPPAQTPENPAEKPAETAQPAAKPADTADKQINKAVEEELAKIPDAELYAKQVSVLNEMYQDRVDKIVKNLPDGETKDKLAEILKEDSYDKVREAVKAFAAESADTELNARLAALPSREPENDHLRVAYILATEPGTTRYGTVKEIETSQEVRGEEGNTVLVKVAINKEELPDLRPGATVTAKVYCGPRTLGYVLLDDLISFIQTENHIPVFLSCRYRINTETRSTREKNSDK